MLFPSLFAYVPWKHHVLIVQKSNSIEEALFYIQKTIEGSLSRNALDDVIRVDLYHSSGNALTYFTEKLPVILGKLAREILKATMVLVLLVCQRNMMKQLIFPQTINKSFYQLFFAINIKGAIQL